MRKIKIKTKNSRLSVQVKIKSEELCHNEAEFVSKNTIRELLKLDKVKNNCLEYYGYGNEPLEAFLKNRISKHEFYLIVEQIIELSRKIKSDGLSLEKIVFDYKYVFINPKTMRLQFLYLPVKQKDIGTDIYSFLKFFATKVLPIKEQNGLYIKDFYYYLEQFDNFDADLIEFIVNQEDRQAVNTIKRIVSIPSKSFETHSGPCRSIPVPEKEYNAGTGNAESNDYYEATGLLPEEDYEATGLMTEEDYEATGLMTEEDYEATGLMTEEDYEATGLLSEEEYEATGLLSEEEYEATGLLVEEDEYEATGLLVEEDEYEATGLLVEEDEYEATGLLVEEDEYEATGLLVEEDEYEATGLLVEEDEYEATGLLVEEDEYEATGLLVEEDEYEATGLLVEDENKSTDAPAKEETESPVSIEEDEKESADAPAEEETELTVSIEEDEKEPADAPAEEETELTVSIEEDENEPADSRTEEEKMESPVLVAEDDENEATGLLVEDDGNRSAVLPAEEEPASENTSAFADTGYDDFVQTGLLIDDETPEEPDYSYDETGLLNEVRYPCLTRLFNGEVIVIDKPVFRIGKERSYVDYFISSNNTISRSHADIITRNNRYFIVDLNSKNRTYVNDRIVPVHIETEIYDNDIIRLSNEEFIFNT